MRAVSLLMATAGCLGTVNTRGNSDGIDGLGVAAEGPVSKLRFGLEAVYERVSTDAERRGVFGYDATVRIGIVSAILEERCEFCVADPWLDFGPAVGVGVAASGDLDLFKHGWIGGWADVRLSKNTRSYPIVRIELQRDDYSGAFRGDTQLVVGFGYVDWTK